MAGAFVDGALKGFEMMERHQARKDNKARLADMDKRNEQRYQDSLDRQSMLDEERKSNRESDVKWRESQAQSVSNYRNETLEANKQQRQWQQKYQTQQAQWQKDQQAIPVAWQSFRDTGQIPEELNDVLARNKGMDPRTYLKPEYREAVKGLSTKLDTVIKSGNMAEANSPETIKLFDQVFGDKIKSSVGQYDETVKSKIASVNFAGFVPAEREDGSVALALQVTYENGAKEIKPMTKGRTAEGDDPVMTYTPKELVGTIKARAVMTDVIERPEYWDKMGAEVAANFGRGTKASASRGGNDYQKQLNSIQDEMTKAIARIEGSLGDGSQDDTQRQAAVSRVKNLYKERINKLNESHGLPVERSFDPATATDEEYDKELSKLLGGASAKNGDQTGKTKEQRANAILQTQEPVRGGKINPASEPVLDSDLADAAKGYINNQTSNQTLQMLKK